MPAANPARLILAAALWPSPTLSPALRAVALIVLGTVLPAAWVLTRRERK